ncbi:2-succinyl-6-hydroxy-2,4-cyclohexadiene-1-carboxylate synthase [Macrococcoides caseolyticum]|uniref:2-succinyl-6-hydroxy-2, 4-cyclohexadiene-1-carboxylate synthase n=1 Tax=Macrococcoides caseolyticum TaxID=69966 RepID=UPI001F3A4A24|nr:2-succinyl-6-hydroxy-2,4-cyclohexadiene-1-carboxylate synthase [Macrococcus caseolyticus]MCE4957967.1 2-succinyl-6-hydroxy-2,4-cyclohexadiene-1-carboxylate synthase [Macrococcus caseolyticus]
MLKFEHYQNQNDQLIVMIHGFLGSIETFKMAKDRLIRHFDVLLVECPGHGMQANGEESWTFQAIAASLNQHLQTLKQHYQSIALYGYSMGGRIALYTALHYPQVLSHLIIESATPGIESESLRLERIAQDEERARQIETNYAAFIRAWEMLPLFKTSQALPKAIERRQHEIRMHHNPTWIAKSLREYGTGRQPNLWPLLKNLRIPVLLLTGRLDSKFEHIAEKMTQLLPYVRHEVIDAGHTIHVENLEIFDTIIVSFIKEENHD